MAITMTSGGVSKTFRDYPQDAFYVDANGAISTDPSAGRQVREAWFNGTRYYPEQKPPDRIVITTPPTKLSYGIGEAIDYSGMIVTAYSPDGSPYDTPRYPHGIIPLGELSLKATADADGQIAVGRDVPRNLRDYLGTAPVLTTVLDVDYPQGAESRNVFNSRYTYHAKAHGNGAQAGITLVEQKNQYTDGYGRRRACVQGCLILASEKPFSYSFATKRTRAGSPVTSYDPERTYSTDDLMTWYRADYFGISFVYDTYNGKTIYVAAPAYTYAPGEYLKFVSSYPTNVGTTALDSGNVGNPDAFSISSPHNIVSRCPLARNYVMTSGNSADEYFMYGYYGNNELGNYSSIPNTTLDKPNLSKLLADIAIYLLYGNITMTATETTLPVSWTGPNGNTLTTWLTVGLTRR